VSTPKSVDLTSRDGLVLDKVPGVLTTVQSLPSLRECYKNLAHKKNTFPSDPTVGLCPGPYDSPRGGGGFL